MEVEETDSFVDEEEVIDQEAEDDDSSEDASVGDSDVSVDDKITPYDVWKLNSQFMYDLLLHHHTSWPCNTCAWGEVIEDKNVNENTMAMNNSIDGKYNEYQRKWSKTPESIVATTVEMTRPRQTQTWFIGKFNDAQRNRNFVSVKHIVHPGSISRIKVLPQSSWVVSHSTDYRVYLWHTSEKANRNCREGTEASIPDITCATTDFEFLAEYPLAVHCKYPYNFTGHANSPSKLIRPNLSDISLKKTGLTHISDTLTSPSSETLPESHSDINNMNKNCVDQSDISVLNNNNDCPIENDIKSKSNQFREHEHIGEVEDFKIDSGDENIEIIIAAASGGKLHVWSLPKLCTINDIPQSVPIDMATFISGFYIEDVAFLDGYDPSGNTIGVAGSGGDCIIVNNKSQTMIEKMENAHDDDVHCIINTSTLHADVGYAEKQLNNYVITGSADSTVKVWDMTHLRDKQGKIRPISTFTFSDAVLCIDFCPRRPQYIGVGTNTGEIALIDLLSKDTQNQIILRHLGHKTAVTDMRFNASEPLTIVSVSDDSDGIGGGTVQVWRPHEMITMNLKEETNQTLINEMVELFTKSDRR